MAVTYPESLPITARREELLSTLRDNQVVVVAGETGSGKSTQLPKMLLELGLGVTGLIGHTQPRRVAARAVAERVVEELGGRIGGKVGYAVRFDDRVGDDTAIKVMTDGILLAELQRDRRLSRYEALIIDEAHERSLNIDFLLGYLKQLLPERPDLKLVVTSATIDTERFAAHFDDAPVVTVSGRTYPVEVRYRPYGQLHDADEGDDVIDDDRDQVTAVCDAVAELGREGRGDVLVFLSGEREIHDTADALAERIDADTEVLPLYARLSSAEQHRVFEPHRKRRIVLATNVAETSLTVPGVRYVVDAGTARVSRYSHRLKVQRLPIEKVSQASADQRAGRCGRVAPGICIRLYGEDDYEARPPFTDPEIQRTNLASVILQMLNLGLGDVESFPFLDPPDHRSIRDGLALLHELGAVTSGDDARRSQDRDAAGRRLTKVGRDLVRLPIDPRLGRMVIEAGRLGCVREVVIIAAALSVQDPRERPLEDRQAADEMHRRFRAEGSDLLALVNLWDHLAVRRRELSGNRFRRECREQFLNHLRVREWRNLAGQVARAAEKIGLGPIVLDAEPGRDSAGAHPDHVHRALLAGLLSQIGMKERESREYRGARNVKFQLAFDSTLARKTPPWVLAAELVETNRLWGRRAAAIDPAWAEELAGHLVKRSYGDPRWDERSGRAVTDERVTLYGLPLVSGRRVGYDRADRIEARDMFIEHALVRREWRSNHRFLADNEAFLADLGDLCNRLRRTELFDDDARFAFYDRRLPDGIVSGRHFDRWWKNARRDRPDLLTFSAAELAEEGVAYDPADYPDTWRQHDVELPVTYLYDPGNDLDGVTVHVPMALLNRVEPWDFDWQVPGYRSDLVETLVGTAPKAVRRELNPITETARIAAERVRFEDRPLVDVLAEVLSEIGGVKVDPSDLDPKRLPPHLRITFAVNDGDNVVAVGKDLDAVRELLGGRVRAAVADSHRLLERSGITRWDFGPLPVEVRNPGPDGHDVVGYPALLDDRDAVAVKVFSRPEIAGRIHPSGLRRLVLLNVTVGVKGLAKEVPNAAMLAIGAIEGLSLGGLLRDVIAASANRIVADHVQAEGDVRDETAFEALLVRARRDLRPFASRALADAGSALLVASRVAATLDRIAAAPLDGAAGEHIAASLTDARAHLDRLVRPGFVASAGTERLPDVTRYLTALERRLEKLPESPRRDQIDLVEVVAVERRYGQLLAALSAGQVTSKVVETGWLLEELRVGVFAQFVGVKGSVSAKKLRRRIDDLFAGNLD
ncbi:MAG: ATP-dependent RNA helicase HrpA [Acidimicrobiales bacterium]|nr:ATP-dependent RNA helicase HrpA [Acidimicrobiales bacterium]